MIWIWRAWPLICISGLGVLHYILIVTMQLDAKKVNDAVALGSQLLGGLFVLYSIDSTIGILNRTSLLKDFVSYVKEFPLIKRATIVQIAGAAEINITGKAIGISSGMPPSIEEQILYLQNQIDALRQDTLKNFDELRTSIDKKTGELDVRIDSTKESIRTFEKKITDISLGGVKLQLLGVTLLIYGAITGYVA